MSAITLNLGKIKSDAASDTVLAFLAGAKLTSEQWQILKSEGVIKRLPKHVKNAKK